MKKGLTMLAVLVCSLLIAGCIAGCSVNPSELSDKYAKNYAGKVKYARDDRTGLCYGVVASRKTASASSTGIGITCVPCEAVEHLLVD